MFSKTLILVAGLVVVAAPAARADISVHALAEACAAGQCTPEGARLLGTVARSCIPGEPAAVGSCSNHDLTGVPVDSLIAGSGASQATQEHGVTVLRGNSASVTVLRGK